MSETVFLALSILAGVIIGIVFYGGLWWTVKRGLKSNQPAAWFMVSLFVRTGVTLTGFYYISGGNWLRLLLCLAGFTVAGKVIMRAKSLERAYAAES